MDISIERAAECLKAHDNILIVSHKSPDGDTLGSAFGLYYSLKAIGKRVRFECSDPIPDRYSYFTGEYVEDDFTPDYIVAVDIAAVQLLGEKTRIYAEKFDLCIDHHPSNDRYAKLTCLNAKAGANCEIIFAIIKLLGVEITTLIANCIYTGISTDTGCFKYSSTTKQAHLIAAELYDAGVEHEFINRLMFETKSKSRMRIEQRALNAVDYFYDDRVAMITITQQMIDETGADESELDGISAIPRTIEGVQVGITMRERVEGGFKLSVRTTSQVDASKFCAKFGGGGHKRAAGCFIDADYDTARGRAIDTLAEFLK